MRTQLDAELVALRMSANDSKHNYITRYEDGRWMVVKVPRIRAQCLRG